MEVPLYVIGSCLFQADLCAYVIYVVLFRQLLSCVCNQELSALSLFAVFSAGVLDEGDDELMNVNINDLERTEKNLENKKSKPAYNPYDMEQDEFGMVCANNYLYEYLYSYPHLSSVHNLLTMATIVNVPADL